MTAFAQCALAGGAAAVVVLTTRVRVERKFDLDVVGPTLAAFLAGMNLPPAFTLTLYVFAPDPASVATKLRGLELFVTLAGLALVLVTATTLWDLYRRASGTSLAIVGEGEAQ